MVLGSITEVTEELLKNTESPIAVTEYTISLYSTDSGISMAPDTSASPFTSDTVYGMVSEVMTYDSVCPVTQSAVKS